VPPRGFGPRTGANVPESNDDAISAALADESTPKALREAYEVIQRQLSESQGDLTALRREAAFSKAGLKDLPHRSLFEKAYEGEMDPDKIRESAKQYGLVDESEGSQQQASTDLEAYRRIGAAGSNVAPAADDAMAALDRAGSNPELIKRVIEQYGSELGVGLPPNAQGYRIV
jgi:hypothetical protein